MEEGQNYEIFLHYQAGNYRWVDRVMIASYIDEDKDSYYFSLRPLAGTQEVPKRDVSHIEWTEKQKHLPRRA
jgi:hypothetical protein